ncbi:MAG: hypothetical protein JSR99_08410 [Proteobacteria bacterium]|nr:hypothetical protein [Pseudomonadota bacterium]
MASPLEGSLRRTIGNALRSTFYACTVTKVTPGDGPPYDPGPPVRTPYTCKGIVDTYSLFDRQNTLIKTGDVKVLVLAASLPVVPSTTDTVQIRGVIYTIIDVATDPAQAVWTLQARP